MSPPPPFVYTPVITESDVAETLVFFRDVKKSAFEIAQMRDARRFQDDIMRRAPPGFKLPMKGMYTGTGMRDMAKVVGKDASRCVSCGRTRADAGSLMRCGGCKKIEYCSAACQKADWKKHKPACK